jgi:hypothetical protein
VPMTVSVGIRGLRGLLSHRGVNTSAGLPGTGLHFVKYVTANHHASEPSAHAAPLGIRFLLPFVILIAMALAVAGR